MVPWMSSTRRMLEHLHLSRARRFLLEARRILRPEGVVRIVVPDLKDLAMQYVNSPDEEKRGAALSFLAKMNLHREAAYPPGSSRIKRVIMRYKGGRINTSICMTRLS